MKKKILLLPLLAILAAIFLLTSCTSKNQTPSSAGNSGGASLGAFESVDINQNAVTQEVFAEKKLTMINIWATFCGPCINEMPDLGQLSKEYAGKDFQIIGIPVDVTDFAGKISDDMVNTAKEIIKQTNADYLHILPSESLNEVKLDEVSSVPETIFVDENGKQIGESYIGSRSKEAWKKIIDGLLKQLS